MLFGSRGVSGCSLRLLWRSGFGFGGRVRSAGLGGGVEVGPFEDVVWGVDDPRCDYPGAPDMWVRVGNRSEPVRFG